jgi:quercetin dioxygenase-like cupin family protein
MRRLWIAIVLVFACGASFAIGHAWQQPPAANRGSLKLLLGHTQLGVDTLAMGERSYPPNYASAEHTHESLEVLYVLEGSYRHVINGQTRELEPGMVAFVKPGDKVQHKTGSAPARLLMIWAPGGEGEKLAEGFTQPQR